MRQSNPIKGKTKEEKIEYLNSLPYSVILKKKKDRFFLIITELSLVVECDNLEKAYQELSHQKQKLFTQLIDFEAEDEIEIPRKTHRNRDTFHQMKIFIFKLVILCVLLGITFVTSGALIANKINQVSDEISVTNILKNSILEWDDISEDKKQRRLKIIRRVLGELRPLVLELRKLFELPTPKEEGNGKELEKQNYKLK